MRFKAVIFDVDGTAVPIGRWPHPSNAVVHSFSEAQRQGLILSPATGRNYKFGKYIIDELHIKTPSIVAAGTQIVDSTTGRELWSAKLALDACAFALETLRPYSSKILVDDDTPEQALAVSEIKPNTFRLLDVQDIPAESIEEVMAILTTNNSLSVVKIHSITAGFYNLHITDSHATKKHAIDVWLELMELTKDQVVGVGDGFNDVELFKSVGHKVAMGNAVQELKDLADEIIDSVDNDGLAKYVESLLD